MQDSEIEKILEKLEQKLKSVRSSVKFCLAYKNGYAAAVEDLKLLKGNYETTKN